jgi:hypothetical protein
MDKGHMNWDALKAGGVMMLNACGAVSRSNQRKMASSIAVRTVLVATQEWR